MTNGNSAERERFEKWIGQQRPEEQGMEQFSWDDCWSAWQARAALSVCADGGKGDAALQRLTAEQERLGLYVMNIPLDAAATMADYVPQRLCTGSHIACNGVDYCLGHPSCRDIAKERAEKDAARYRFLRAGASFTAEQGATLRFRRFVGVEHAFHSDWVGERFDASVDAAIDAAIEGKK